jgi:alkylation response protein AidB-like acyl-CoA dehydrogenase
MMAFPISDVTVHDTWHVSGLKATASNDWSVDGAFVPARRTVWVATDRAREPGALYAFPPITLLALGIAAVALGIARTAIDELVELAGGKKPQGSNRSLAERPVIQSWVAQAEAALRSSKAFMHEAVADAWSSAAAQGVSVEQRTLLRLAARNACTACARAVDLMYEAGGGTSIYESSRLQHCFRDVHVLTAHMMVAPAIEELTGRLLLGLETDAGML